MENALLKFGGVLVLVYSATEGFGRLVTKIFGKRVGSVARLVFVMLVGPASTIIVHGAGLVDLSITEGPWAMPFAGMIGLLGSFAAIGTHEVKDAVLRKMGKKPPKGS